MAPSASAVGRTLQARRAGSPRRTLRSTPAAIVNTSTAGSKGLLIAVTASNETRFLGLSSATLEPSRTVEIIPAAYCASFQRIVR